MVKETNVSVLTCIDTALSPSGELPFPPGQDRLLATRTAVRTAGAGQSLSTRLAACWALLPSPWVRVPRKAGCPRHPLSQAEPKQPCRGREPQAALPVVPGAVRGSSLSRGKLGGSAGGPAPAGGPARAGAQLSMACGLARAGMGGAGYQPCRGIAPLAPLLSAPGGLFCWLSVLPLLPTGSLYPLLLVPAFSVILHSSHSLVCLQKANLLPLGRHLLRRGKLLHVLL